MINIIFILIFFIVILFILHCNYKESFISRDNIIFNENTLINSGEEYIINYTKPSIDISTPEKIYPKEYPDHNYYGRKISANKLCVYNDDDPENPEIECIDAENLGILMKYNYSNKIDKLPEFRLKNVCINTSCISNQTMTKMDSSKTKKYYLKSGSELEQFKDKCVHYGIINHAACDRSKINLHSFIPEKCDENIEESEYSTLIGVDNNSGSGSLLDNPKQLKDLDIYSNADEHHIG